MNWLDRLLGEYRETGRKPTRDQISSLHREQVEHDHAHRIAVLADRLLAGDRDWAESVMGIELGLSVRLTHAAMAVAVKRLQEKIDNG